MDKTASTETGKYARAQASSRLERLAVEIGRVVKSADADAVHDLRVAIRRLTQTMHVFKRYFRGKTSRKIRRELKRIMLYAGEVRNYDIAMKLVSKSKKAGRKNILTELQSRRRKSAHALTALLKSWQKQKLSSKWGSELEIVAMKRAGSSRKTSIGKTAKQQLSPMAEKYLRLGNRASRGKASPAKLHRFRILAKKYRYSLELFMPVYGSSVDPLLRKITHAQDLLGDINDCETVRETISQFKGMNHEKKWLEKRQLKRVAEFQKYWNEVFGKETEIKI